MFLFLIMTLQRPGGAVGLLALLEVPEHDAEVGLVDLEDRHPDEPHRLLEPPGVGERVVRLAPPA